MPISKTTTKKTSKKTVSKKTSKKATSKKEPKLKVFCGITQPIPKGYKLGSMKECLEHKQVRYYGLKKIDSKLVESMNDNKATKLEIISKMASLRGKIDRLKKEIDASKNANEKKKMIDDFQTARKEILLLNEKLQKIK
jgi:hypothetical protein